MAWAAKSISCSDIGSRFRSLRKTAFVPPTSSAKGDDGRFRKRIVYTNMQVANANNATRAIIARLPNRVELIGSFLCASVNSRRALSCPLHATPAARLPPVCEGTSQPAAHVADLGFRHVTQRRTAGVEAKSARPGGFRCAVRRRACLCGPCAGAGVGRGVVDPAVPTGPSRPVAGSCATGRIPAGRCGFPTIVLTCRDPGVIRSAGWQRLPTASEPTFEPPSRLFASMGDIRDSGWISRISVLNGQFAIYRM